MLLNFWMLCLGNRVYFECRNTEISHAILLRPIIEFFVVSGLSALF